MIIESWSESWWTYMTRPIRFIHVRWTGVYALTRPLKIQNEYILINEGYRGYRVSRRYYVKWWLDSFPRPRRLREDQWASVLTN